MVNYCSCVVTVWHSSNAKVGCWYKSPMDGQHFEVVAIDCHDKSIDIQYADGDIGGMLPEVWKDMGFIKIGKEDFCEFDSLPSIYDTEEDEDSNIIQHLQIYATQEVIQEAEEEGILS